jgi:hypothetical protein
MFTDHGPHETLGHIGFTIDTHHADDLYGPPMPSTLVNLFGPYDAVIVAATVLSTTDGLLIVDAENPHPCSVPHGCVHAMVVLDGHIGYPVVRDAISAVFGPPIQPATVPPSAGTAHLN